MTKTKTSSRRLHQDECLLGEEVNDEMSRLRGYGRVEMPVINFVPLNVHFDNEKIE